MASIGIVTAWPGDPRPVVGENLDTARSADCVTPAFTTPLSNRTLRISPAEKPIEVLVGELAALTSFSKTVVARSRLKLLLTWFEKVDKSPTVETKTVDPIVIPIPIVNTLRGFRDRDIADWRNATNIFDKNCLGFKGRLFSGGI